MNDTYVSSTFYVSDSSDYVSSVVTSNTPFPSLTKSQRMKIYEIINKEPKAYVSTFTQDIEEVSDISFKEESQAKNPEGKNSCCCLC